MATRVFGAVLLFGLATVSVPVYAQSVYFQVCNAGKVDVDVFVSGAGKVSSSHVGSANCATVAETAGAMGPASVGLALVDSRGQWAAARRLDLLPALGEGVLSRATQNISVRHGNANVPLSTQLLFRPRVPTCNISQTSSQAASLPLNATAAQRNAAAAADLNRPAAQTTCDTFGYTLNVEAYADTGEITFKKECDPCDKKAEAKITPEERAARQRQEAAVNQAIGRLIPLGPAGAFFGSVVQRQNQEAAEERAARESRLSPTRRMEWSDLLTALRTKPQSVGMWAVIPRNLVMRGTVSSVEVSKDAFEPAIEWVDVAFRESPTIDVGPNRRPYSAFNVCTSDRAILQQVFGPDFMTSMIGKTVEIEGETQGAVCRGLMSSIRVTLAHQVRPVKSAQFEAGSVPRFIPPPVKPVQDDSARIRREADAANQYFQDLETKKQKTDACVQESEQFAKAHPGDIDAIRKEYYACLNAAIGVAAASAMVGRSTAFASTPAPAAAPAAAPNSAAAQAKAKQDEQDRLAQAAKQRDDALKQAQKVTDCMQQLQRDHPDGGRSDPAGFQKELLACAGVPRQ
jgi:hypothetical protein